MAHSRAETGTVTFLAPLTGVIVPLEQVPDPAFAQRLAGDGASIDPLGADVVAPCDARVRQVHGARHALTLEVQGLEVIIHVGLDTVALRGEGFTAHVKAGDHVRAGDRLLSFDADFVATHARSLLTQVLVTNTERVAEITVERGRVTAGRDVLMRVRLAGAGARDAAPEVAGAVVESGPVVVAEETGIHARPAAALAAAARRHGADVRIVKGGIEANARSVVSLIALEMAAGDTVTVLARGDDARDAVNEIARLLSSRLGSTTSAAARAAEPASTPSRVRPTGTARSEALLHGVPASGGAAIGTVHHLRRDDVVIEKRAADASHERRALDAAIAAARLQLEALRARVAGEADGDKADIFAAHQELLEDPEVLDRATADIMGGASAAFAWRAAYTAQADRLAALRSAQLAGRAADLRDVGRRVLHLLAGNGAPAAEVPPGSILVAEDLSPSDAVSLDRSRVLGFCTTMGSATSHVAILARGLGIPAVAGMDARVLEIEAGTRVVLDGDAGTLCTALTPADEAVIERRRADAERRRLAHAAVAAQPAVTTDGHRVAVMANIGSLTEAERVVGAGGEGVGLLRTEFLFMDRETPPDEEEQARVYATIARALGPDRLLVIRTLDIGGDKPVAYLDMESETNPFLGERGIRLTLRRPEFFAAQVRAILRASRTGNVAIMFPMVATLAEWSAARALVERECLSLGMPCPQVGLMVEVPAAAMLAEQFAADADFLSIGTNDLTQYTMAMDRTNPVLAPDVDALHPAVLRLIDRTVQGAAVHGRHVAVCGALAGDAVAVPVLLGLGVHELSCDVPIVPAVKARIRGLSLDECANTAREALAAGDGAEVRAIVARRHEVTA